MNNNKQLNKGDKMRKIAMIVGMLSVLATSADAGYWYSQPNFYGGMDYHYNYDAWELLDKYSN